jgi:hypothetical protein
MDRGGRCSVFKRLNKQGLWHAGITANIFSVNAVYKIPAVLYGCASIWHVERTPLHKSGQDGAKKNGKKTGTSGNAYPDLSGTMRYRVNESPQVSRSGILLVPTGNKQIPVFSRLHTISKKNAPFCPSQ